MTLTGFSYLLAFLMTLAGQLPRPHVDPVPMKAPVQAIMQGEERLCVRTRGGNVEGLFRSCTPYHVAQAEVLEP